jgi:hypothetical protein
VGKKPIPRFGSEDEEREFWATADSTDYVDWEQAKTVTLSNLKPSIQAASEPPPADKSAGS